MSEMVRGLPKLKRMVNALGFNERGQLETDDDAQLSRIQLQLSKMDMHAAEKVNRRRIDGII